MNAHPELAGFLDWLVNHSLQAAVLVLLVVAAQWLFRRRLSSRWRFALWWVVVVRLLLPFGPPSAISVFNYVYPPAAIVSAHRAANPVPEPQPVRIAASVPPAATVPTAQTIPSDVADDSDAPTLASAPDQAPQALSPAPSTQKSILANQPHSLKDSLVSLAMVIWLSGMAALMLWVLIQIIRFRWQLSRSATLAGATLRKVLEDCRREFNVKRRIELLETDAVKSPALFGLFRLRLLLPKGFGDRFNQSELRYIFLHELAHIKRGDLWMNWLITALQIAHWFNPLIWFGFARLRSDRELACDELALLHAGEKTGTPYGETIIKLLEGLSRPAAIPGLVGILEDKKQMRRRIWMIANFKRPGRWSALALLLLGAIAAATLTDARSDTSTGTKNASPRPDLTGSLTLTNGQPARAKVFIWTAAPKVGTSTFCPSCWADCVKSAKADAHGNFKIGSLDPQLLFRILVVGEGITPKFVEKVDPAKGPLSINLEPQNLANVPPTLTLRGRIVDAKGAPIEAAAIEPRRISRADGGEGMGVLRVADPLAISDAQGRFVLTTRVPFTSLGVWVEARGFAPNAFKKLDNDGQEHQLVMTEGASLKGRVLYHGKPLPNVSVATFREDLERGDYPGHFEVGTDAEGRFQFFNLPPGLHYSLAGQMSTLQNYGAIPAVAADTGPDGSTKDIGDLTVQPAFRISGHVVLTDSQPLPSKTRLLVSSREAGAVTIDLDRDGSFAAAGIAPGSVSLSATVPGYHWSLKNPSLDQLNPWRLVGRVYHDITNLVLLMDKGTPLESHFDGQAATGPQPEFNPLKGVENRIIENQSDQFRRKQISGRLTDAESGKTISRFRVTLGQWNGNMLNLDWNPNLAVEGSNGTYAIELDNRNHPIQLKFEAEGYLPAATPTLTSDTDHCDFSLTKGSGPSGTVLSPDGRPAAGVKVLLTCPQPGNGLLCLLGGGKFQDLDNKEATTDASGHFSFTPQFGMKAIAASGTEGFKLVTLESLQTNANITLEPWGSIKGVLRRPSGPGADQALRLDFAGPAAGQDLWLSIEATTDNKGAFEFNHVPPGDCEISTSISAGEDVSDTERLQRVHIPPGQTVEVSIQAPEKAKPVFITRESYSPPVTSTLHGIVLRPDGQPAAGAQVGLKIPQQELHVGDGELEIGPLNDSVARTEADGSFTVPMRDSTTALYALNEAGFAKVPRESWTNGVRITLQPWGRVEGVLRVNNQPAANGTVELSEDRNFGEVWDEGGFRATTVTDDRGHFVFAHVPAGDQQLYREIPFGKNGWMSSNPTYISVQSGETTNVTLGGAGRRPVVGKCAVDNVKDLPEDPLLTVSIHAPYPTNWAPGSDAITSARQEREQRKRLAGHSFRASASPDGSFQVDDVPPGTYEINFEIRGEGQRPREITMLQSQPKQIIVPPLSDPEKSEPFDLGTLKTALSVQENPFRQSQANAHSFKAGDSAPAFETRDLNGRTFRLSDYRGKFVLLDFRYMLPGGEMEGLQSVNKSFGADNRFVIISLCQTADEDFLKDLSAKGATHWIQGNLDLETLNRTYGLNGANFPLIMLVDPQGKIVATGLHGDDIQSTVATALAQK